MTTAGRYVIRIIGTGMYWDGEAFGWLRDAIGFETFAEAQAVETCETLTEIAQVAAAKKHGEEVR